MKRFSYLFALMASSLVLLLAGCDKNKAYELTVAPAQAHFVGDKFQTYSVIGSPAPVYNVIVGTTDVASTDRVISYTMTTPTGASAAQYSIGTTGSVTIPAGQSTANIDIHGVSDAYLTSGRKDTLIFTLASGPVEKATFLDTVKLLLRGPCFDGDVTDLTVMNGDYANSTDPDDPVYLAKVSGITALTPTSGTGVISNLWDFLGGVNIVFDWSNPTNTTVTIANQLTGKNYAAGQPLSIRTSPGKVSKFSVCNETITLTVDIIVNNYPSAGSAAYYAQNYPMTIRR